MNYPPVDYHSGAMAEAHEALAWYAQQSVAAAQAFERELLAAEERIVRHPDAGGEYLFGTRMVVLRRFPFVIVYRRPSDSIQIVAIARGSREPGYWRERLG